MSIDIFSLIPPVNVLVADPAWRFGDKLPGGRGADAKYKTLALHEIQRFPLPPIAESALLVLWRVGAMVEEAYAVVRAWGFTPKSEIVWVKTGIRTLGTPPISPPPEEGLAPDATIHMGLGHYVRNAHEVAIVATRGRFEVADKGVRSVVIADIGLHSEKPDAVYREIERLGGEKGTYAELFARRPRVGWHVFGDELPGGYVWTSRDPIGEVPPNTDTTIGARDAWAIAQSHAQEERDQQGDDVEDLAELTRLPRHKVRRPDGLIVPACCATCLLPQYAAPEGVTCTNLHSGAPSIPGCAFCGEAAGHRVTCDVLPTEPPPAPPLEYQRAPTPTLPAPDPVLALPAPPDLAPNPVLVAADLHNAAQGTPTRQADPLPPAPYVPDIKRDILLVRAKDEGLLSDADLAEGADAAWIKLLFRAPPHWFPPPSWFTNQNGRPSNIQPGEHIDDLARDLTSKGLHVSLVDLAKWTPFQRALAGAWASGSIGEEPPEWLAAYKAPPAHAPQCAAGCIGAEAGCPAARHAWAQLMPEEVVIVPPEHMGEIARGPALKLAAPTPTPAAEGPKRGRGRPPGAKNKPKDPWAAAERATAQSENPEVEEGFFS